MTPGGSGTTGASGAPAIAGKGGAGSMAMMGGSMAMPMAGSDGAGTGGAMASDGGMPMADGGDMGTDMGMGSCCKDGDCLCHGMVPTALTSEPGPYKTESYDIFGVGCVYYPTDAEPPFAAVAIADGFGGSGGCGLTQTNEWGPLYASWGIVAMIVDTGAGDQPFMRGAALSGGIAQFKMENTKADSPLHMKLSGRYGTSGFSMGGGGTTYAASDDPTLKSNVAIMAWGPVSGLTVPSLFICGDADALAGCGLGAMGSGAYAGIDESVPKAIVTLSSIHYGQPSADGGKSGQYGLAFQKVFLEGDERWRPLLVAAKWDDSTIK
jgi:hypothetical protein